MAVQQGRREFGARSVHQYVSTTKSRERRWWTFSTSCLEHAWDAHSAGEPFYLFSHDFFGFAKGFVRGRHQ